MTDRDRLIEKLDKSFAEQYEKRGLLTVPHTADDLLANGVIVPPCKVGDVLFCIFSDKSIDKVYTHIETCRVTDIKYFASDSFVFGVREINLHYNHNVVLGENAFKTFVEAEKKLKELK